MAVPTSGVTSDLVAFPVEASILQTSRPVSNHCVVALVILQTPQPYPRNVEAEKLPHDMPCALRAILMFTPLLLTYILTHQASV